VQSESQSVQIVSSIITFAATVFAWVKHRRQHKHSKVDALRNLHQDITSLFGRTATFLDALTNCRESGVNPLDSPELRNGIRYLQSETGRIRSDSRTLFPEVAEHVEKTIKRFLKISLHIARGQIPNGAEVQSDVREIQRSLFKALGLIEEAILTLDPPIKTTSKSSERE
jgi:hypothetical protein